MRLLSYGEDNVCLNGKRQIKDGRKKGGTKERNKENRDDE